MDHDERIRRWAITRRLIEAVESLGEMEELDGESFAYGGALYDPLYPGKKAGLRGFIAEVGGTRFLVSVEPQ